MADLHITPYTMGNDNMADGSLVPASMGFHLLEEMTDGFSELLGKGGFGKVFKGVYKDGQTCAVKVLNDPMAGDDQFQCELSTIAGVRHPNIVRVHGFCHETLREMVPHNGNFVFAENIRKALCMEYMSNGSLTTYLSDESNGHDWHTNYRIIKGVCQGLKCLHESDTPILHLDLKLDNILLDEKMEAKIADFGLSRLSNLTQITERNIGTFGYMPPEFIEHRQISKKFDIFSLGVVIMKVVVGPKGYSETIDMSSSEVIDYVRNIAAFTKAYGIWRNRLEASPFYAADRDLYYEQIRRCCEIALNCVLRDRHKRPGIGDIVKMLNETETMISFPPTNKQGSPTDQMRPFMSGNIKLVDVHPLRLHFPFEPNKLICCPLQVKNNTEYYVAFRCLPKTRERCFGKLWQLWDTLPPRSTRTYVVAAGKQQQQPQDVDKVLAEIQSCVVPAISNTSAAKMDFADAMKETGAKPYQVTLTADFSQAGDPATCEPIRPVIKMIQCPDDFGDIVSMDIHPKAPWILAGHSHGYVSIWDYETEKKVVALNVREEAGLLHSLQHSLCPTSISASKFAPKDWFAVGDTCGYIHVHRYMPNGVLKILKAHSASVMSLAIHSSDSLLLSSSCDGLIKLWNWKASWECIGRFKAHSRGIVFNPHNDDTFASVSVRGIAQIWSIYDSDHPKATFGCHCCKVFSVDYFSTDGNNCFIITGSANGISHIWDLQTKTRLAELEGSNVWDGENIFHFTKVGVSNQHPPLLITSYHNAVSLINSTNYRHENKIEFNLGQVYNSIYIKRTRSKDRLVVAIDGGIAVMEINHG